MVNIHPAANLFPLMNEKQLQALTDDIREKGQLCPILVYEDMILDGRNRFAACQLAGVEPRCEPAPLKEGQSPALFVISINLQRRQLSRSQRAVIAVDAMALFRDDVLAKQKAAGSQGGRGHKKTFVPNRDEGFRSIQAAAKIMQIGHNLVDSARSVQKADPELFERIRRGEIRVSAAYQQIQDQRPNTRSQPALVRHNAGKRVAAYESAAETWRQSLCAELRRRRESIEGKRKAGSLKRWNVESIGRLELLDLLDWVEKELVTFTGKPVNGRDESGTSNQIGMGV